MSDQDRQKQQAVFWEIIKKPSVYPRSELQLLRENLDIVNFLPSGERDYTSVRLFVELLDAIARFDEASATLVKRSNKLQTWVLILTVIYIVVAVAPLVISIIALRSAGGGVPA